MGLADTQTSVFNGEALPADALNDGTFPIMEWLGAHGQSVTRPILDKAIEGLKSKGIKTFAAVRPSITFVVPSELSADGPPSRV